MKKILATLLALTLTVTQVIPALASGGYSAPYPGSGDNGKDTVEITIPDGEDDGDVNIQPFPGGEVTIPGGEDDGDVNIQPFPGGSSYTLYRDGESPVLFLINEDGTYRPVGGFLVSKYVGYENPLVLVRQNGDEKTVMLPFDTMDSTLEVLDTDELVINEDGTVAYRPAVGGAVTVFDTMEYADERDAVSLSVLKGYVNGRSVQLWTDDTYAAEHMTAAVVLPFLEIAGLPLPEVLEVQDSSDGKQVVFPGNRVFGWGESLRYEITMYELWAFRIEAPSYRPIDWDSSGQGNGIVVDLQNSFSDCLVVQVDSEAAA